MSILEKISFITGGIVLRACAYVAFTNNIAYSDHIVLQTMLIRRYESIIMIREEVFRFNLGVSSMSGPLVPYMTQFFSLLISVFDWIAEAFPSSRLSHDNGLFVVSVLVDVFGFLWLHQRFHRSGRSMWNTAIWCWFNPIMICACALSPIPSIELFLLASVSALIEQQSACAVPSFILLLFAYPTYIVLCPALWALWNYNTISKAGKTQCNYMATPYFCFIIAITAYLFKDTDPQILVQRFVFFANPLSAFKGISYEPSLGILWYLDAQAFQSFRHYLAILVLSQPYLMAIPLFLKFGKTQPRLLFDVTAVLTIMFKPALTLCDVTIGMVLLAGHTDAIAGMRYLPVLMLGILASAALSPLTVMLWLSRGSGNANYLFFQGLALWIFASIAFVEFVRSATTIVQKPSSVL